MDGDDFRDAADAVYEELLARTGEGAPEHRLDATRRLVELLGDPQRAYPIIHLTGTNGKTSTSRIIESLLRACGLRTGLLTSPHLIRFTERIVIDGEPLSDEALVRSWADVKPYVEIVDAELADKDKARLTFFEVVTALAFAVFADSPVDVAVIEVGMGGEWDSTNVGDGDVAVFTPISLDHTKQLGSTVSAIAHTKSGIIKPCADVVTATQQPDARDVLREAADANEATFLEEGHDFEVLDSRLAVGGQVLTIRGRAATYSDVFLPLYGEHQAHNAALALAAVETFLGRGTQALAPDLVSDGLGGATSPGRLQLVGVEPPVFVDAAHNPAGAEALVAAVTSFFSFSELAVVVGSLADKDSAGVVVPLTNIADRLYVTQPDSDRARDAWELAELVDSSALAGEVLVFSDPREAIDAARAWAAEADGRAVLVTGSIVLIGMVMGYAADHGWKATTA